MNFTAKHQLDKLPVGTKIQFITYKPMNCDGFQLDEGTTVTLTKVRNLTGKKPMWVNKFMKWSVKWIPNQFQVVK